MANGRHTAYSWVAAAGSIFAKSAPWVNVPQQNPAIQTLDRGTLQQVRQRLCSTPSGLTSSTAPLSQGFTLGCPVGPLRGPWLRTSRPRTPQGFDRRARGATPGKEFAPDFNPEGVGQHSGLDMKPPRLPLSESQDLRICLARNPADQGHGKVEPAERNWGRSPFFARKRCRMQ